MPNGSNSNPNLITPDELKQILRISKTGVYRLVEKRSIPFYKVSGSLRFERNDVLEYLRNNRVEPIGLK
ncbi:helix-turn-helix domain-containing protein [uncultured Desulfosarcina sp.]|uniref:helix-turn-helix domain-containing protein n=1 Tax=uncultured Desulfosarcina sp. TaxID=218289 RepID=UPI0037485FB3